MGFANYGVLVGNKTEYHRDPLKFGKFFHGNVQIAANDLSYHCAIDVDTQVERVQWRIIHFTAAQFQGISSMGDGWHHLLSNSTSGAIDYIRWKPMWVTIRIPLLFFLPKWRIKIPPWIIPVRLKPFGSDRIQQDVLQHGFFRLFVLEQSSFWLTGSDVEAIEQLESVITQGTRMFVFGEFFDVNLGVHNIHQNQGDEPGNGHDGDNAIWQDGATIVQKSDGNYVGFFNKFEKQSFHTDSDGKWLP